MTRRGIWMSVGAVVVLLGCLQGTAMAKMVIWSAMKGRVLMNGQPAAGAVLKRNFFWHWKSENGSDETKANAAGEFSFPAIERSSFLGGLLPHEPVIEQATRGEKKAGQRITGDGEEIGGAEKLEPGSPAGRFAHSAGFCPPNTASSSTFR